jgi:hypothetical protein
LGGAINAFRAATLKTKMQIVLADWSRDECTKRRSRRRPTTATGLNTRALDNAHRAQTRQLEAGTRHGATHMDRGCVPIEEISVMYAPGPGTMPASFRYEFASLDRGFENLSATHTQGGAGRPSGGSTARTQKDMTCIVLRYHRVHGPEQLNRWLLQRADCRHGGCW